MKLFVTHKTHCHKVLDSIIAALRSVLDVVVRKRPIDARTNLAGESVAGQRNSLVVSVNLAQ